MKIKKWPSKVRRFFSLNKKQLRDKDGKGTGVDEGEKQNKLPWSPDDILDEFQGLSPIPSEMKGYVLLMEVGGVDQGYVLDFSGDVAGKGDEVVTARYDIPQARLKSKKSPTSAPPGTYNTLELKTLPWIFYKDLKVFSKIETGKLSDMVAFVTGRIAVSGEMKPWEGLDGPWKEAKERVTEKRKLGGGSDFQEEEDDEEEEENIDEEARIIATYKPEVEPKNPFKKEFWKRHLGTDFLVGSYLFLISSAAYMFYTISRLVDTVSAHTMANAAAGVFFTLASIYFIKLSYPETIMLMAYHVMSIDPNDMTFFERYFAANEMLIALWLFTAGFLLPYVFVVLYELFISNQYHKALVDIITSIVAIPLTAVFNISAMPDAMRANNGRGSSFFFDKFWVHLLCLKAPGGDVESGSSTNANDRYAFWVKHVGNDGLAGAWIFAIIGIISGIGVIPLVIMNPTSPNAWFIFWSTMPFSVGAILLVRASYPENMNTSIFFGDDSEDEEEIGAGDTTHSSNGSNPGEETPLLP